MRRKEIEKILFRIKEVKNFKRFANIAEYLEVSSSGLANYKNRCTLPLETLFKKCIADNINFEWVMTGNGEKFGAKASDLVTAGKNFVEQITNLEKRIDRIETNCVQCPKRGRPKSQIESENSIVETDENLEKRIEKLENSH